MRYIANKLEDNIYEVKHIKEMETIDGEQVEVIVGTNKMDKLKLEETIKTLEEEKLIKIEQIDTDLNELKNIFNSLGN